MRIVFRLLGFALCILPPALAVLECFPLWLREGDKALSALALLLLGLCALPLWRYVKHCLHSPSVFTIWLVAFVVLTLFRAIVDELWLISLVAFPTSFLGAVCFRIAKAKRMQGGVKSEE